MNDGGSCDAFRNYEPYDGDRTASENGYANGNDDDDNA
jgi:hypothetical protein